MSYNILANSLLKKYQTGYSYVLDQKYLDPDYRLDLLVKDLEELLPDIMCLQEVDKETFEELWMLLKDEYEGNRIQRLGGEGWIDGLATFYNKEKFVLINEKRIDLDNCFDELEVT